MAKIIEAKAVISAEDRTGAVFDKIAKKFQNVGKGAKVSAEVERLGKSLEKMAQQGAAIDKLQKQMSSFGSARTRFRDAQAAVEASAKALAAAGKPSRDLESAHRRAQTAVTAAARAFEKEKTAVLEAKQALANFGGSTGRLVRDQSQLASAVDKTTAALDRQIRTEARFKQVKDLAQQRRAEMSERRAAAVAEMAESRQRRKDAWRGAAGVAGIAAVHKAEHLGAHALHTYQEFDNERRFGRAVMGISDEEQKPLVDQAIHLGATTRYNDVQVLESQRELAARGLKRDQVMGLISPAADLGQSLDLRLPDAVKQMEGAIFGFKKDISTLDAAMASARQTADVQVKAAKISGMTPEDITQTYKYGATAAQMSGVSEQNLLAFGGISKKANMGGDEAGVAFRALIANATSPTRKGKEALLANGLDFKNYQKAPERIDTAAFVKTVAAQYGVKLDKGVQTALNSIFSNKTMIANPEKFTPAVMNLLSENLGGDDAKSKKSIAGLANRFRDASMGGVDTNKFIEDMMKKLPGNLQLANSVFGSKQGSRIANAFGDPETFKKMLEELLHHSQGYAADVANQRNAGFDGAVRRLQGAGTNLDTKLGRAFDADGNGGFLTQATDAAGKLVQSFAELDNRTVQIATGFGAVGTALVGLKSLGLLMDGFGLKTSAVALTGSAEALTAAAARLGLAGAAGGAGGALGTAGKATGALGALGAFGTAGAIGLGLGAIAGGVYLVDQSLPNHNRMNGNGRGVQGRGPGAYMPGRWGNGSVDVSGGIGATGGSFVTNRPKTWSETIFGGQATFRGGRDPTRMQLPNFDSGRQMRMPDSRLDASTRGPITAEVKTLPPLSGEVKGQATVSGNITVEPSQWFTTKFSGLEQSVMQLSGKVSSIGASVAANGPGSTGKSSPDAGKGGRD